MGSARWRLIGMFLLVALSLLAINWNAELIAEDPPRLIVKYQGTELTDGTVARVTETGNDSSVILTLELSEQPTPATGKLARFGDDPAITVYPWPAGVLLANLDFVHPPDIDITPYHTPARLTTFQFNTTNWSAPQRLKLTSGATSPGTYKLRGELLASRNFHGVKFPEIEVEVVAGNSLGSLAPVTLPSHRIWIHSDGRINKEGDDVWLQISSSHAADSDITVSYSTKDGKAIAGADYVAAESKQVTIPKGKRTVYIRIETIFDEVDDEGDEQFTVEISPASTGEYVITGADVTATITSLNCFDYAGYDDLKITLPEEHVYSRHTWRELRLNKNSSRQFDVALKRKPCDPVSVTIQATQGRYNQETRRLDKVVSPELSYSIDGANFSNPLTLSFDGSNWSAPQTVTLRHQGNYLVSHFSANLQLTALNKSWTQGYFYGSVVK